MSRPLLVWLLLSTIWGSTWLFIKLGLQDLPPFTFAGIRFILAVLPLVVLIRWRRPEIPRSGRDWRLIALTGILTFSVSYGLVFWGESHISSGLTAILYTTCPLFGLLIAHFYLPSEPMTLAKLAGLVIGMVGVTIIFSQELRLDNVNAIWGASAVVLSALSTAYASVLIKLRGGHLDPLVLTSGQMTVGLVPLLLVGLPLEGNPLTYNWTPLVWVSLFYLALVGSSLTFVLLYWLMQKMEVTKTQLIPLASTLIAVLLGRVVLGEALGLRTTFGAVGILLGLALTTWGHARVKQRAGSRSRA